MLARYRSVLGVPGSARLYATGVLARIPQGMAGLAILLLVRGATHSYALSGIAIGAEELAAAVAGPLQGRLIDRFGAARVLAPCAVLQAAVLTALVLAARGGAPHASLVILAAGSGACQPAIAPSARGLLRSLFADPEVRESAYALDSVVQELIWITGPLLVAAVVAASSPATALLVAAAVCVAGTVLFVASPASRAQRPVVAEHRGGVLRGTPQLRVLLLPVALMGVSIGGGEVGLPSLALHAGDRASTGLLLAVWSLGSMIGGLVYGARAWRGSLAERYRVLLALAVLCGLPLVFARSIPAGLVGALLTGLTIAPVFSCQYALVAGAVADGRQTEAFTWVSGALIAGIAVGSSLGGLLIGRVGVGGPFMLTCAALLLAAATSGRVRRPVALSS